MKLLNRIAMVVVAALVVFGFFGCIHIEREQSAAGIAHAMAERSRGAEFGWSTYERDLEDMESLEGELGLAEALEFGVKSLVILSREEYITASIWEFETPEDANSFVERYNSFALNQSPTNVSKGRFALTSLKYPKGVEGDGGFRVELIRTKQDDVEHLVRKFNWAVTK